MIKQVAPSHWLHPLQLLGLFIIIKYGAHLLTFSSGVGVLVIYLTSVLLFTLPLFFFSSKPLIIDRRRFVLDHYGHWIVTAFYLITVLIRLVQLNRLTYSSADTPSLLFNTMNFGWLLGYALLSQRPATIVGYFGLGGILILETSYILLSGNRMWLLFWGLGLALIWHTCYRKINWYQITLAALIFLLVVSPMTVILRYSLYDTEQGRMETFFEESREFTDKIEDTISRVGAEGVILERMAQELLSKGRIVTRATPDRLKQEITKAVVPNIVKSQNHSLDPGARIYKAFWPKSNKTISYPTGLIGGLLYYFGRVGFLLLPLFAMGLIVIWNRLLSSLATKCGWIAAHFSYMYVLVDTHLLFWATSWTRGVIVYGTVWLILVLVTRHQFKTAAV